MVAMSWAFDRYLSSTGAPVAGLLRWDGWRGLRGGAACERGSEVLRWYGCQRRHRTSSLVISVYLRDPDAAGE